MQCANIITQYYMYVWPHTHTHTHTHSLSLSHTHTHTLTHTHTHTHTHTPHIHAGQYPQINDDLVNSHHLLLCCMDMLFCAAVEGKRRDLLNPECGFLPKEYLSPNFVPMDEKMCVLTELSATYGGKWSVCLSLCL